MLVSKATILGEDREDALVQSRTTLVRVPKGVTSEVFGGWGVRI